MLGERLAQAAAAQLGHAELLALLCADELARRDAAGLARRCEVQVAYAIGAAHPVGLYVETFGTETVAPEALVAAIRDVFDLRPAAIVRDLDLLRPIYRRTAAYGHFGRELPDFTWERTDRVDDLRRVAGI